MNDASKDDQKTKGKTRLKSQREAEQRRNAALKGVRGDVKVEFGEVPAVVDPKRKAKAFDDLLFFLTDSDYFPETLGRSPLCSEQVRMIRRLELCLTDGGNCAHAVFRGGAKSTSLELAILWSLLTGRRSFCSWYGATASIAKQGIQSILSELEENDRLAEDWPEACHLFRALEGNRKLCHNQKYDGVKTHLYATGTGVVIPFLNQDGTIEDWACIRSKGLNADDAARGMRWKSPTGKSMRPDCSAIDDPQTDESARSPQQTRDRLKVVTKSIAKSGSRDKSFAICVAATVIEANDFADQLLDPDLYPSFSGERVPQMACMPLDWKNKEGLWLKYKRIRSTFDKKIPGDREKAKQRSRAFYLTNRKAMDKGARATWESAIEPGEISAIQSCMNALLDLGEESFASECQQKPINQLAVKFDGPVIQVARIWWVDSRITGLQRGIIPDDTIAVTGGIDVQGDLLFWMITAWRPALSGHITDYGTFPENQGSIDLAKIAHPLSGRFPNMSKKAQLRAGLNELITDLINRQWLLKSGRTKPTSRILIDSGHEAVTVYEFCAQSVRAAQLNPAKGYGIGVKSRPMSDWKQYVRRGDGWVVNDVDGHSCQLAHFDGNIHKRRVQDGIMNLQVGDPGKITIFEGEHHVIGEHFSAEAGVLKQAHGRSVYEWETIHEGSRNDFWDTMMMSRTAAMIEGVIEDSDSSHTTISQREADEMDRYVQQMEQSGLLVEEFSWG